MWRGIDAFCGVGLRAHLGVGMTPGSGREWPSVPSLLLAPLTSVLAEKPLQGVCPLPEAPLHLCGTGIPGGAGCRRWGACLCCLGYRARVVDRTAFSQAGESCFLPEALSPIPVCPDSGLLWVTSSTERPWVETVTAGRRRGDSSWRDGGL